MQRRPPGRWRGDHMISMKNRSVTGIIKRLRHLLEHMHLGLTGYSAGPWQRGTPRTQAGCCPDSSRKAQESLPKVRWPHAVIRNKPAVIPMKISRWAEPGKSSHTEPFTAVGSLRCDAGEKPRGAEGRIFSRPHRPWHEIGQGHQPCVNRSSLDARSLEWERNASPMRGT